MNTIKLLFYSLFVIFLPMANKSYAQEKPESAVDKYLSVYANEKNYKISSVTEDMIKTIRKQGVWGNPKFDLFMSQIKLFQHVSFNISDPGRLKSVFNQLMNKINNSNIYKLYTSSKSKYGATYIYTLANDSKVIIEVVIISIFQPDRRIQGASFLGDNINFEAIKGFADNK